MMMNLSIINTHYWDVKMLMNPSRIRITETSWCWWTQAEYALLRRHGDYELKQNTHYWDDHDDDDDEAKQNMCTSDACSNGPVTEMLVTDRET